MIDEFGDISTGYTNYTKGNAPIPPTLEVPKEINSQEALLSNYALANHFLQQAHHAPLNQKAQALNSIVNIIEKISKLQIDLYNAERFKQFEEALIETLKEFPEVKEKFIERYQLNSGYQ